MLSGYASGGQVGLPLAAALLGATVAALVLTKLAADRSHRRGDRWAIQPAGDRPLLRRAHFGSCDRAVCAPLLGWLPELPRVRRLPAWARGLARVILVAAVVSVVVFRAQRKFDEDFHAPSEAGSQEISPEDYMNFGK